MDLIGIKYPLSKENGKFPATLKNVDCVDNDILTLFRTPVRSRVMRPTFGTAANQLVFEPNNSLFVPIAERVIKETLLFNEPRAKVQTVSFQQVNNLVVIDISYLVQGVPGTLSVEVETAG